jgi:23S rRNA pseudouridine2605 synthase
VFTVGRLDLESEGLILATNDGELANQLTHPKHGVEKTYIVQVAGHPDLDVLAQIRRGVYLSEGYAHAVDARIKSKLKRSTLLEMVLDEGRNREVRRLLARVGHKVQRLTRIAVGPVRLGEMPRGAYRRLTQEEVRKLHEAVEEGLRAAASPAKPSPGRPPRPGRPPSGKPPAGKPVAGKRPAGQPLGKSLGKPVGFKPRARKPMDDDAAGAGSGAAGAPGFRRKIVGDADGAEPAGQPPRKGRPHGGKPKFRKTAGTKAVGRKPFKRRRREKPER